jgi:Kef-type K+ transport system membrane component KefB
MTSFLQLVSLLALILIAGKFGGSLSKRFNQPAVLGEILVGILLGPSLIDLIHLPFISDSNLSEIINDFANLGTMILMFLAGMELHLTDLKTNLRPSLAAGAGGDVLSILLGMGAGLLAGMPLPAALFLGLTIAATSISISVQTLMELKALKNRVGLTTLGATVIDDIIVILLLAVFLVVFSGVSSPVELLFVAGRMISFILVGGIFGIYLLPRFVRWSSRLPISQSALTLGIVVMLIYALAAEIVGGMAAITGAFFAGLMFSRLPERSQVEPGMQGLGYGLFIPIFFVNIGLSVQLKNLSPSILLLLGGIILAALVGKFLGAGGGARLAGLPLSDAMRIGVGMIPRGEVTLIVAAVGMAEGYLTQSVFSAVVAMLVVTALATPPLLRAVFHLTAKKTPLDEKREVESCS